MDTSIFTDKHQIPDEQKLQKALGRSYKFWEEIRIFTLKTENSLLEEWNFPGEKYGWSYRIKDKKKAIVYLLPRENYFKVAFVFGQKAVDAILLSNISENIKDELNKARVYAEGRGIRIEIKDTTLLNDIKELIEIKLSY